MPSAPPIVRPLARRPGLASVPTPSQSPEESDTAPAIEPADAGGIIEALQSPEALKRIGAVLMVEIVEALRSPETLKRIGVALMAEGETQQQSSQGIPIGIPMVAGVEEIAAQGRVEQFSGCLPSTPSTPATAALDRAFARVEEGSIAVQPADLASFS